VPYACQPYMQAGKHWRLAAGRELPWLLSYTRGHNTQQAELCLRCGVVGWARTDTQLPWCCEVEPISTEQSNQRLPCPSNTLPAATAGSTSTHSPGGCFNTRGHNTQQAELCLRCGVVGWARTDTQLHDATGYSCPFI
jgi:hypothetical protein